MRIVLTDSYLYLPTYMHGEEAIRRKGEADDYRERVLLKCVGHVLCSRD